MDKLIHDQGRVTISNDGATIIKLLDIVHPAAKTLCDIAKSQDDEVNTQTDETSSMKTYTNTKQKHANDALIITDAIIIIIIPYTNVGEPILIRIPEIFVEKTHRYEAPFSTFGRL